jgi:deoxyribodipyrimidine photo-lyase
MQISTKATKFQSTKQCSKAIFLFRRDLRLTDNTGLAQAIKNSKAVLPCFIFDPCQVGPRNAYRGSHAMQVMIESVQDLDKQLIAEKARLHIFYGDTIDILKKSYRS